MKITLDKNTITLGQVKDAKAFAADNTWIDSDILKECANKVLQKYYGEEYIFVEEILKAPALEVTYSSGLGFGVYATGLVVSYWHKDEGEVVSGSKIAIIGCNVTEVYSNSVSAFVQIFGTTDCRVI